MNNMYLCIVIVLQANREFFTTMVCRFRANCSWNSNYHTTIYLIFLKAISGSRAEFFFPATASDFSLSTDRLSYVLFVSPTYLRTAVPQLVKSNPPYSLTPWIYGPVALDEIAFHVFSLHSRDRTRSNISQESCCLSSTRTITTDLADAAWSNFPLRTRWLMDGKANR